MTMFPISLYVMPFATLGLFHAQGVELELLSRIMLGSMLGQLAARLASAAYWLAELGK